MAKAPPNLPAEGDKVRRRDRQVEGRLTYVNTQNNWCRVTWETAVAPRVCHLYDLEKIDA